MKLKSIAIIVAALCAGPAIACGGPPVCTVKDPTGTPLNVRASPNGRILATLKDGQVIEVVDHQDVDGKRWARIAAFNPDSAVLSVEGGWVFARYLRCDSSLNVLPSDFDTMRELRVACTVNDPTGTPLNIRLEPRGEIDGTVRNGTNLRAAMLRRVNGQDWVWVEKWGEDNAIGWVYDPYLACEEEEAH
jgi:hypothetical protein